MNKRNTNTAEITFDTTNLQNQIKECLQTMRQNHEILLGRIAMIEQKIDKMIPTQADSIVPKIGEEVLGNSHGSPDLDRCEVIGDKNWVSSTTKDSKATIDLHEDRNPIKEEVDKIIDMADQYPDSNPEGR